MRKKLKNIINNIEKSRILFNKKHIVDLVAVSKYSENKNIEELYSYGQRCFGENQVQQLEIRKNLLNHLPIEWHMIGILQKNKINMLIDINPYLFQSLGDIELAKALNNRLAIKKKKMNVLLQINTSKDINRYGFKLKNAIESYKIINQNYENINLKGVMTTGVNSNSVELIQNSYKKAYQIYEELKIFGAEICSMGTSSNYHIAIECGSNLVRIGSELLDKKI